MRQIRPWIALIAIILFVPPSCSRMRSPGDRPAEGPAEGQNAVPGRTEGPVSELSKQAGERETWMSCTINGAKIGYMHFRERRLEENGQRWIQYSYDDQLTLKRFTTETVIHTEFTTVESPEGRIRDFRSLVKTGPTAMRASGRLEGEELVIVTETAGHKDTRRMAFDPGWGGFVATDQSLERKPMKPGETRHLKALVPVVLVVADITMKARAYEAVELPAGPQQLLRIDVATDLGTGNYDSTVWTDRQGTVWKTRDSLLKLEAVVTSRERAMAPGEAAEFDLGFDTIVRLQRPLIRPHETRRVVYRATLKDGDIKKLFPVSSAQSVGSIQGDTAEVTVRSIRPDRPVQVSADLENPPTEAHRKSSPLLQTNDALVRALAEVATDEDDPWKLACLLERHVRDEVSDKNYSTAMATAAEVAETLAGDCTEHAMLLAALCRVRGIPSRVAIGLVYYPAGQAFAYHMWTEVWIRDRWIALDATLGRGGIGAAHIKLADSAMESLEAFVELLPVIQAIGRLQLEVLQTEYGPEP